MLNQLSYAAIDSFLFHVLHVFVLSLAVVSPLCSSLSPSPPIWSQVVLRSCFCEPGSVGDLFLLKDFFAHLPGAWQGE